MGRGWILAVSILLSTPVGAAEINADTVLRDFDTGGLRQRTAEELVLRAESAFREANSALILQRSEFGLYCPQDFSAKSLVEMVRRQVGKDKFLGGYAFEMSLLHALQTEFPPPCGPTRR